MWRHNLKFGVIVWAILIGLMFRIFRPSLARKELKQRSCSKLTKIVTPLGGGLAAAPDIEICINYFCLFYLWPLKGVDGPPAHVACLQTPQIYRYKGLCNNYLEGGVGKLKGGHKRKWQQERGGIVCKIWYIQGGALLFHSFLQTGKVVEEGKGLYTSYSQTSLFAIFFRGGGVSTQANSTPQSLRCEATLVFLIAWYF